MQCLVCQCAGVLFRKNASEGKGGGVVEVVCTKEESRAAVVVAGGGGGRKWKEWGGVQNQRSDEAGPPHFL